MQQTPRPKAFAPASHALALEPRILFDGAAASAVEQHHTDNANTADATPHPAATAEPPSPTEAPPAPSAARHLLVLDSRVENREQLTADLPADVKAVVVNTTEDGLAAISAALAELGKVDSIQIFSHGASGQFTLGNRTLTAANLDQVANVLDGWRASLNPGADIQLYGCNIGAGTAGRALVEELAQFTGADVGASSNDTGASAAGGDWNLEVRSGLIDRDIALGAEALAAFDGLLADAGPTTTLPTAEAEVLLGDQFSFTVDFANVSTQPGFAPFVTLFMPATGKDGDDGVTFISASYLGQNLVTHVITFDANGQAIHPLAQDANGNFLVINAADFGMRAGDQMVVVELPFASVTQDQPIISVQITASLSNLADTSLSDGSPDLTIRVSGGFEFGNDALDDPTQDPSLIEAVTHSFIVHPTVITATQTVNVPEGETATGPNYGRTLTTTVTPANGQTLTNVTVTQPLPGNIQVTAITPAAGGVLTSITLADGQVVTNPAEIAALIAADNVFISQFTVTYATLTGPTDTLVQFYVPDADSTGQQILDPATGAPVTITIDAPTASGQWVPLDPRDVVPPETSIDFTATGEDTSFVAKSITLLKTATLQVDVGHAGISVGDTLNYRLDMAVSDFFAYGMDFFGEGELVIRDQIGDGQTLTGTPTMTVTLGGVTQTIALVTRTVTNPDGTTSLEIDIAQSLRDAFSGIRGWFNGDLAFDSTRDGAATAVISYSTVISQSYTPPSGAPHSEINEGDSVGNAVEVSGTILEDIFNLTGSSQSDTSSSVTTIPTSTVDIQLVEVNDGAPPPSGELRPGDEVTFRLSYDLITGDYENFQLTAYLPLPLFDVSGITWTIGDGSGQWQIGTGNSNAGPVLLVSSGPGNSVVFDFGSFVTSDINGSRIVVEFTLRVGDQPFADQRSLDVLAQSTQQTTLTDQTLISSDIAVIVSVAEPVLNIRHGVVSTSHGTVTGTTGTWGAPGSTGVPFSGSVTELDAVNGDVSGIDGGDLLRLATAIENSGGGGAFDVVTSITLPPGLSFAGGSLAAANLQIYRGDGTLLVAGVDYAVTGNSITFLDANNTASLLAGRAGTPADASGANMVVIVYDVVVDNAIAAARSLQSTAILSNYASVEGGSDFTPTDLQELAGQQVAAPEVRKVFAGGTLDDGDSSATHTTGADLVIGESMQFDIVVTLPEGTTQTLRLDDLIPPGLRLDPAFNGGQGYLLITTAAGSGALTGDFAGTITVGTFTALGGSLGDDGGDVRWTFSVSSAAADNDTGNNTFVIRVQLVASNVTGNQAGTVLQNNAQALFSDPDGDTPNGTVALERTVTLIDGQPTVFIREPTLQVTQQLVTTPDFNGFDEGDPVEFTITIANGAAGSDFNAFDISFADLLPTELDNLQFTVTYLNGATNNGGADFELVGGQLRTVAGANIDIVKGGSIVIRVTGVVNATAAAESTFDNVATVQWTSLDGTVGGTANPAGERTGVDGPLNSGVLNDYQRSSTLLIPVNQAMQLSRVGGLPDTPAPTPDTLAPNEQVTVGEVIRYRLAVLVPEGDNPNYQLRIELENGLQFIDPAGNNLRIALISNNGGLTSDALLALTGGLQIEGNETNAEARPITADLSGAGPVALLNAARVTVINNPDGSQTVIFDLGNLVNANNDADLEGIVLEFNVRVLNQASNVAGATLDVQAHEFVNGVNRSSSEIHTETIVEPGFNGLNKQVTSFDPNPSGTTGTATVSVSFTQNGGLPAFDTRLTDSFPGGSNYTLISLQIGGNTFGPGNLPPGVTFSNAGGITIDFAQIDPGTAINVVYQVTVPNDAAIANSNAVLTWTSLPEDFTAFGGSTVGTDGQPDGERTGSEVGPNTYILREGAGLGIIAGTLWNDTGSATGSAVPDGPGLPGQTVTLTWAGADGDLASTADNLVFSAVTDINGQYRFGVLPAGIFRIDAPAGTISYPQPIGDLRVRIDTDAASPLGQIVVTLGEGATGAADAGYVEQNDAPVNTLPGTQNGLEDVPLPIAGISVADIDANRDPDTAGRALQVTLTVANGTLSLSATPPGVTVTGANSASLTLTGNLADLNAALANLVYLGNLNFNGIDTLTVRTSDLGNFGDADGDGIPGENPEDALIDQDSLQIVLQPVNDPPIANPDVTDAVEAGGTFNNIPGVDPRGNLLANDTDVDIATNADVLRVVSMGLTGQTPTTILGAGGTVVNGTFGHLVVTAAGGFEYVVHNDDPRVQALRLAGETLVEQFTYTISDLGGLLSSSTLTVTIHGANDTPVGVDDDGSATEAGGVLNGTPGSDATGNVLANDTDVDNGDARTVTGIRNLRETAPGTLINVPAGTNSTNGTVIVGTFGTLTIGADGSYRYVLDNNNTAVQRLVAGDTLIEFFSYQVTDLGGLNDIAQLRIVINGANDNPVASDDQAAAQAASTNGNAQESNPTGNVILFPSRPGDINQPGGNGVDQDVDRTDRPNTLLNVTGIRVGEETAGGALTGVDGGTTQADGTVINGLYGTLRIGADGSFFYDVDSTNAAVQALGPGETLDEFFTYEITDTAGLTDQAQLHIIVRGVNDPPVAQNVVVIAREAGGVGNGTPGVNPSGDATANAFDPDGDPLTVTLIRAGAEGAPGTGVPVLPAGTTIVGLYGSLTIRPDGTFDYVVNNDNPDVQALRDITDILSERFTYTLSDGVQPTPETDAGEIIVLIFGQNDNPVAADDAATAVEAGGINNGQAGVDPVGNVLANDTDVDGGEIPADPINYGETQAVSSVRTGAEAGTGTAGTLGTELRGTYGWLTLNADGSYSYRLDNAMAEVQALRTSANTLTDQFSYTVSDTAGAEDRATLTITIVGANDAPVANNDNAIAVEAGGLNNNAPGIDPTGNVLANDTDVDAFGETLSVISVGQGSNVGTVGTSFIGTYGTLTLNADGSYTYVLDNANPAVQALRTPLDVLRESFTYSIRDLAGATSSALLTITIQGRNDNPIAVNDSALAVEAGGTFNDIPGIDPSGNLLTNDTDVDANDGKVLTGVRAGPEAASAPFTAVNGSQSIQGLYGTLTVAADGSYTYVVNNDLPAVQGLKIGDSLVEQFTYSMRDTAGATDIAQLNILIRGAYDAPVARNDFALAAADNGNGNAVNPTGNVLANDTDVDFNDQDRGSAIRVGSELLGGTLSPIAEGTTNVNGTVLTGRFGTLIIGANGSYVYLVDSSNPEILALGPLQFVEDVFTYQVTDLGTLSDLAELHIIIRGRNDTPTPNTDEGVAIEAGGLNNATPGFNPTGNVLANDTDLEGDQLTVTGVSTGSTAGTLGAPLRGLYGDLTLNADGTWSYVLDNSLPEVEALRTDGQILSETFTYTLRDALGATASSQLTIIVSGRNDTPIANDDASIAIEAGGIANGTPGAPGLGNVLANDTDVDSIANGETKQVLQFASETGQSGAAGQVVAGRFGQLLINADGSYSYVVDDANPTVQALRTAGETLSETFTYTMADTAGATSVARLTITIQGANDNPVAQSDSNVALDQTPSPQASGNVLPNDGDIDNGDALQVVGIRTGAESGSGSAGTVGQPLAGRYGTLILNADGSYTYAIDLSNPEVLAAAGLGRVLQDVFTYTIADLAGATDQAELVITLDIAAPFIPAPDNPPMFSQRGDTRFIHLPLPDIDPAVFVGPVVERESKLLELSSWGASGGNLRLGLPEEIRSESIGAGLGVVEGQFVAEQVAASRLDSNLDLAWMLGRHERINLSADGLLASPSVFASDAESLTRGPAQAEAPVRTAPGFSAQLQAAAQRLHPGWLARHDSSEEPGPRR
ncbi:VCBS domain-containing protein [Pseudomonas schmalbachii]|uniref:VCBS domain-containing protein n=1 Tax=Pseudomonas schmalbachii TaxID=2816993 RepID=A0ABS3TL15_9PSED|nr:VCBS domain-containing protein [Pseudomonas schmalbachii]MBO3273853.1 VCBS domain-containing protein [Pseudomonas schmalbachii]